MIARTQGAIARMPANGTIDCAVHGGSNNGMRTRMAHFHFELCIVIFVGPRIDQLWPRLVIDQQILGSLFDVSLFWDLELRIPNVNLIQINMFPVGQ